ncbi:MAG: hypothetical protein FJ030_12195 [Chloroflexi bacterium]|nr:hypothetical protein [Chloroflexota bacterium]
MNKIRLLIADDHTLVRRWPTGRRRPFGRARPGWAEALRPAKMESPESSSPIVTRAVAAGLRGEHCENYELPRWQKIALAALGRLSQSAALAAIPPFQILSALPPSAVSDLSIDALAANRLRDYASLPLSRSDEGRAGDGGRYPAIAIGAALGGATARRWPRSRARPIWLLSTIGWRLCAASIGSTSARGARITRPMRGRLPIGAIHCAIGRNKTLNRFGLV